MYADKQYAEPKTLDAPKNVGVTPPIVMPVTAPEFVPAPLNVAKLTKTRTARRSLATPMSHAENV